MPTDEAGDVLQEHERDAAQVAQLDEVRGLERRLGEQHAVVGDDADEEAVQPREAGDERRRRSAALNSSKREPSTSRAITSRTSCGLPRVRR
mgnify:CR=1 FL=1